MTEEQQKEQLSVAYVRAVAAVARVNTYKPEVDDDSVDIGFCARLVRDRAQRPRLEAQLKCTSSIAEDAANFRFALKVKNYDDLRIDDVVPRVLIVMVVPDAPADWLAQSAEEMVLRKSAYWVSLTGQPETDNTTTITVAVPKNQRFDVAALRTLLEMEETT